MKENDRVRLKVHKQKFLQYGYDVGAEATIIEPKVDGYWLIRFDGECVQDEAGVWYYTGRTLEALDEDLELISGKNQ